MKRGPKPKPKSKKHSPRLVCMDDAAQAKAKEIGKGNVSKGVQIALAEFHLLLEECSKK